MQLRVAAGEVFFLGRWPWTSLVHLVDLSVNGLWRAGAGDLRPASTGGVRRLRAQHRWGCQGQGAGNRHKWEFNVVQVDF